MVIDTFEKYPHKKLNKIWLSYMMVLNKVLEHKGNNDYKMPHMNKTKLERTGNLPLSIKAYIVPLPEDFEPGVL